MALWQNILIYLLTIAYISLTVETVTALIPIKEWNRCPSSDYKIESFWDVSLQTCSKRCDVTHVCLSFNYFPRGKFCTLLANNSWEGNYETTKQPCIHGLRSTNKTKHVCNKRDGNCNVTACSKAVVKNADVFGNMYAVGSRIKVKCHKGYRLENDTLPVECGDDGNWTNVPFCSATDEYGARSYTFGFLQNSRHNQSLYIVALRPATVVFSAILQNYRSTITVEKGTELEIPNSLIHSRDTGIFPDGFRLESDAPLEVYIENWGFASSDGTVVIPDKHLSAEYILLSWMDKKTSFKAEFAVIGTVDDTHVNIFFPNGSSYDIYLNCNQVYSYKTTEEISGIMIASSNNVAVFAGHRCSKVYTGPCDHLYEQMPPVNDLQTDFIVSYPFPRYKYILKITCILDNTKIELSNGMSTQLNSAHHWQELFQNETIHIRANNPILVAVYSLGNDSKPSGYPNYFDGSMLIIPGLLQFKPKYTAFVPKHVTKCVLMITYPSYMSSLNNIKLNHMGVIENKSVVVNVKQRGKYTVLYTELAMGFSEIYTTDGTPFGAYLSFFRDYSESWFSLPYKF